MCIRDRPPPPPPRGGRQAFGVSGLWCARGGRCLAMFGRRWAAAATREARYPFPPPPRPPRGGSNGKLKLI
eukprot:5753342-Alexandrium_andersonii.AAC.1